MWVFTHDIYVSRSLAVYGEYTAAETEIFNQLVVPGATVVEVGANIGSHSVFLARKCAPGAFYAFEPQQRVFQLLCANLTINGITNASAYPEALGGTEGYANLAVPRYDNPDNVGGATLSALNETPAGGWRRTRVSTLDSWQLPACDFLKIDVEGWEQQVLEGATQTITRFRPAMYVENDRASQQAALIDLINQLGYRMYWHVANLFRPNNFNAVPDDIFRSTASLNMLCIPRDRNIPVTGFEEIDPTNWRSPMKAIG